MVTQLYCVLNQSKQAPPPPPPPLLLSYLSLHVSRVAKPPVALVGCLVCGRNVDVAHCLGHDLAVGLRGGAADEAEIGGERRDLGFGHPVVPEGQVEGDLHRELRGGSRLQVAVAQRGWAARARSIGVRSSGCRSGLSVWTRFGRTTFRSTVHRGRGGSISWAPPWGWACCSAA